MAGPDLRGPGRPSCCDGSWSWLVGGCELLTSQTRIYEVCSRTPSRPTWGPKADLAAGRSHGPGPNGPNRRAGISECQCIPCVAKGASTRLGLYVEGAEPASLGDSGVRRGLNGQSPAGGPLARIVASKLQPAAVTFLNTSSITAAHSSQRRSLGRLGLAAILADGKWRTDRGLSPIDNRSAEL